ncbi:MAG TPA: GAF domain-containing sensor histidine kinase [Pseudonocardiaceae bacterium]|nr:GAF domain-containing sensor histidine kinase [Pseudonocardiaceae bacterium]
MGRTELEPGGAGAPFGIAVDLELDTALRQIVESARDLTDARYGAFLVFGAGNTVIKFVHSGIDDATRKLIGRSPTGQGLLRATVDSGRSLRLADMSEHPAAVGFPPHHPPMRSLLSVPVRITTGLSAQLCVTDRDGGAPFTEKDERTIRGLADVAGMAVQNAQLYERSRRRQRLLEAIEEISTGLLAGADAMDVLQLIADRALALSSADHTLIALPADITADEAEPHELVVAVGAGHDSDLLLGLRIPMDRSTAGAVFRDRVPVQVPSLAFDLATDSDIEFGPALVLPLRAQHTVIGVLTTLRRPTASPFAEDQLPLVAAFADQAALGLQLARSQRRLRELDVLAERDRIAADLHDHVIQRLFAVGLALRSTQRKAQVPEVVDRLSENIDHLHDVITEIRNAIYDLHATGADIPPLRTRVREVVHEITEHAGLHTRIEISGPLEVLPAELAEHAEAVLREAVSNAVRHARAGELAVAVSVVDDLVIEVADDGIGLPARAGRRSGLRNLSQRAVKAGGTLNTGRREGGGTRLVWRAPLPG